MNPRVEYAIGRVRGLLPLPLTRLLVAVRSWLGWRNPAVREDARAQMRFLLEHTRPDVDLDAIARRYVTRQAWRGELRWHLRLVSDPDVVGFEHLQAAQELGRGVVLSFLHTGQYEGASAAIGRRGLHLHRVVLPIHVAPDREGWMRQHMRVGESQGGTTILSDAGAKAFADVLADTGVLYLASDVPGRTPVRFVGRDLRGSFGAARLAMDAKSPVVVMTQELPEGAVLPVVRFHEPLMPEDHPDARSLLEAVLAVHETAVVQCPEIYDIPTRRWGLPTEEGA